jgi:hypothetical protein
VVGAHLLQVRPVEQRNSAILIADQVGRAPALAKETPNLSKHTAAANNSYWLPLDPRTQGSTQENTQSISYIAHRPEPLSSGDPLPPKKR